MMNKILNYFIAAIIAVILAACGGGGGSSGGNPSQPDLVTTAGAEVILPVGAARNYQISGGIPPYRVGNTDQAIAIGQVSGDTLTIGTLRAGGTKVSVLDNSGKSVSINVKVGSSTPLYTNAPGSLTVGVGSNVARTFFVGGGGAPYTVEGGDSNVATVRMLDDTQWRVTGVAKGATTIKIRDAAGEEISIALQVGSPELRISPDKLTMPVGLEAVAKLSGGQPPYRVAGGIPAAITAEIVGDELRIKGNLASKLDISVMDAAGQIVKVEVEINTATTSIRLSPSDVAISESDTQSIQFGIFGAVGKTCVFTSDPSFFQPTVPGCAVRNSVTLETGTRGSRCVNSDTPITLTVVDEKQSVGTATVTIVDNGSCGNLTILPGSAQVRVGATMQLAISGGSGDYIVSSDNPVVATATASGVVMVVTAGSRTGTAIITLRDKSNVSKVATLVVTVVTDSTPGVPPVVASPQTLNLSTGASADVLLSGGSGNYDFAVSNSAVATATLNGGKLTVVAGNTAGNATITVRDQADATRSVTIPVAVTAGPAPVQPMTASPSSATGAVSESLKFLLQNGTAPYDVVVSNPAVASVQLPVAANLLTVQLLQAGDVTLVVTDAKGQTLNIPVTVKQGQGASLRFAPSAFEISEDDLQPIFLTVFGGTPPYRAITSDLMLSSVQVNSDQFSVGLGTQGNRCINPVDQQGNYIPSGFYNVTLTVMDAGGAFATSVMTIRDNGTGMPGICPAGGGLSTTAGLSTTILFGSSRTYSISGGAQPYTVASSNPAVAAVALSSQNGFSITGLTVGTATVTIRDAAAGVVNITVTVSP
jgi:hypothetical protein